MLSMLTRSVSTEMELRRQVIQTCLQMSDSGLVVGTSGNVSVRLGESSDNMMLVTPTGVPYHLLKEEDIVVMSLDGSSVPEGQKLPTSEWQFHGETLNARRVSSALYLYFMLHVSSGSCLL